MVPTRCILNVGTVPTRCILNVGMVPTFNLFLNNLLKGKRNIFWHRQKFTQFRKSDNKHIVMQVGIMFWLCGNLRNLPDFCLISGLIKIVL